ncbi:MAG: hypothetical protein DMG38_20375 [Acidobacteria bacterium]|nr:MAG: hypothetical protein DMG38_20375 [Acidobacteriota bacterium]
MQAVGEGLVRWPLRRNRMGQIPSAKFEESEFPPEKHKDTYKHGEDDHGQDCRSHHGYDTRQTWPAPATAFALIVTKPRCRLPHLD